MSALLHVAYLSSNLFYGTSKKTFVGKFCSQVCYLNYSWLIFSCLSIKLFFFQETSMKDDEKPNEKDGLTPSSEILFNPNVLTEFKLAGAPEVLSLSLSPFHFLKKLYIYNCKRGNIDYSRKIYFICFELCWTEICTPPAPTSDHHCSFVSGISKAAQTKQLQVDKLLFSSSLCIPFDITTNLSSLSFHRKLRPMKL